MENKTLLMKHKTRVKIIFFKVLFIPLLHGKRHLKVFTLLILVYFAPHYKEVVTYSVSDSTSRPGEV